MTTAIIAAPVIESQDGVVLGVDTHRDIHVAAVLTGLGAVLATGPFPATAAGYRMLLEWARGYGAIDLNRPGVSGDQSV